jgi:hypothetical protein
MTYPDCIRKQLAWLRVEAGAGAHIDPDLGQFIERGTEALKLAKNEEIIKEAEQVSQQGNFMLPPSVEAPITWEQLYGVLSRPRSQTPFRIG